MNIQTERLLLRPFSKKDKAEIISLLTDAVFMAYSPNGAMTYPEAESRYRQLTGYQDSEIGKLAVIEKTSGSLIGYCGVEPFKYHGKAHIELGYRLAASARGNGYAVEASKAVLRKLHQKGHASVLALAHTDNSVSHHVLQKLGFKQRDKGSFQGMTVQFYEIVLA